MHLNITETHLRLTYTTEKLPQGHAVGACAGEGKGSRGLWRTAAKEEGGVGAVQMDGGRDWVGTLGGVPLRYAADWFTGSIDGMGH